MVNSFSMSASLQRATIPRHSNLKKESRAESWLSPERRQLMHFSTCGTTWFQY